MNINAVNGVSFKAQVSPKFVFDVNNFLKGPNNQKRRENFQAKVDEYKLFGNPNMTVVCRDVYEGKKKSPALFVEETGYKPVLLAKKDTFRQLIGKFHYINKYEFEIKVKQAREQQN